MNQLRDLKQHFSGNRLLVNIVLDGYGIGSKDYKDAVFQAKTPFMDHLRATYASTMIYTHGFHVGLPGATDLGGSEVGHLTLGAGQIIAQGPTMISNAMADGSFFVQEQYREAIEKGKTNSLHLFGLLSDGNVHSHIDHFIAVIKDAAKNGVPKLYLHVLMDGRDVGIQSAGEYTDQIERVFAGILKANPTFDYAFASAGGREIISMDRDQNWAKIEAGYRTHVLGKAGQVFGSMKEAIEFFRSENKDLIDQDMPPFNIKNAAGEVPRMKDGDVLLGMNFRADRASQFAKVIDNQSFTPFAMPDRPKLHFVGMSVYDADTNLPKNVIMGSPEVKNPFGKRMLDLGFKQFRLAETQKFAHVTFFFNGGYRNPLDASQEHYLLIDSDKIQSFADAPKMKALEIAAKAEELISSGDYAYGLINFANADMVGHTGKMKEAIEAVETVDVALKRVIEAIKKAGGVAVITADHGNADEMLIKNKKTGGEEACTKHSINPVPLVVFDPNYKGDYKLQSLGENNPLTLAQIAATNFILLGLDPPTDLDSPLFEL
ncbi:MAG: 2,3-bisphosphoglycerate-independent phosphoglycerate mutase [SAR324 cluster bacterium]|nr:2,3-bisphosphoglycerate-independent phosphoglycerate mutase [SAR324 cluster bacterium]